MDLVVPETWDEAAAQLLPVLRRVTEPAHAWQAEHNDANNRLIRRPFAPLLRQMVVLDLPDVRMYVNSGHLQNWGVGADQAFDAAIKNLHPHAATGLKHRTEWGLWQLDSGDGYEASRLLLPTWLAAFEDQVAGRPVVAIPGARVVLIGGEADDGQMATLIDVADRGFRGAASALSPELYTVDGTGKVIPWTPPQDHPMAGAASDSRRLLAAHEYAEQTAQLLDDDRETHHICSVGLGTHDDGHRFTTATWDQRDGPTLLPRTDRLVLVHGKRRIDTAFEHVERHAGGCLQATTHNPERFEATWPMPKTLERILAS